MGESLQLVGEERWDILQWFTLLGADREAQLTVPWSAFSVDVVAGDAVLYLLEIFEKYEIVEYWRMFTLSDGSSIYISGAEVNGFPALEMNPKKRNFLVKNCKIPINT